jgi:hypothetical protein
MGIAKLHAKNYLYSCKYEKFWLKFHIHAKFCAKKKYLFRMNAQFRAKSGFVLIQKMMRNFVQNHATVAQEI